MFFELLRFRREIRCLGGSGNSQDLGNNGLEGKDGSTVECRCAGAWQDVTAGQQAGLHAEGMPPQGRGRGINRVGGVGKSHTREGKGVWAEEGASCLKTRSLVGVGG